MLARNQTWVKLVSWEWGFELDMASAIADSVEKGAAEGELMLYGGAGTINDTVGNASPYTGKVEAFLRMNGIPYGVGVLGGDYRKSPKKMVRAVLVELYR